MYKDKKPARLRVCLLVTQDGWGGAQRYVHDLATAFQGKFFVAVATGEPAAGDELTRRLGVLGVPTRTLRHLRRSIRPWDDLLAVFEIARYLRAGRFDVLHTNSSKADVLGALAARLSGHPIRTIATVHGWVFLEPLSRVRRAVYLLLERLAAALRDCTIVLSESERAAAVAARVGRPDRLIIIPHGLRPVTFLSREAARAELRAHTDIPSDAFVIGAIANHYPNKGLDLLLRAAPDGHIVIIGDGPERRALELIIRAEKIAHRARLLGALPDAARFLTAFDVFVLPSRKEGLPYTLIEALSASLPIVATAVGGVPEIIAHEKNGLLVPAENPTALRDALRRLQTDEPLRARLSSAALDTSRSFDIRSMIAKTVNVYRTVTAPFPQQPPA